MITEENRGKAMSEYKLVPVDPTAEIEEVALAIHQILKKPPTDLQDALLIVFELLNDTPTAIRAVAEALWERCREDAEQQPAPDELSEYDRGFRDGKLDRLIDEVVAESELVEALELISVTDPNEGVAWFHEIAYKALAAHRKQQEKSHDNR